MNKCLFSVIIPLYNKRETIANTLQTVLKQTVSDFEIIIVDDGSTDGSEEIVSGFNDERINLIRQQNQGVSSARNHGIRESKGKYICFLDADDEWSEDFLSVCLQLFEKYPQAKMVSPSYRVKYNKKVVNPEWRSVLKDKEDCLVNDFFEMATGAFWTVVSSCVAIERDILIEMDRWFPENEKVYEDFDMWIRIGAKYPVAHSNKVCATYVRTAPNNARKAHKAKVIYSATYMQTLQSLIDSAFTSDKQKEWLTQIKDRRMVVYIFSLLCVKQRKNAKAVLKEWCPSVPYRRYAKFLKCASIMPYFVINLVQSVRMRVF